MPKQYAFSRSLILNSGLFRGWPALVRCWALHSRLALGDFALLSSVSVVGTQGGLCEAVMPNRPGVQNAFLTQRIFSLRWVYQDVTRRSSYSKVGASLPPSNGELRLQKIKQLPQGHKVTK